MSDQGEGKRSEAVFQIVMDRIEIENLLSRYYLSLSKNDPEELSSFFTDDAELDVNGLIAHGPEDIADLYREVAADKPRLTGTFRMLLNNLVIELDGDTAIAEMLWTQTLNDTLKGPPRFIEQGREFDQLVRRNGEWRILKRVIIADSGMPDFFDATYSPRVDYKLSVMGNGGASARGKKSR